MVFERTREVRVPRIEGLLARASAEGWRTSYAAVPVPPDPAGGAHVDLVLGPAVVLAGTVRSPEGAPVAGALVGVHLAIPARGSRAEVERLRVAHEGPRPRGAGGESGHVVLHLRVVTDAEGAWRKGLPADGLVRVTAHAPGFAPSNVHLGFVGADEDPAEALRVVLEPVPEAGARVRFLAGSRIPPPDLMACTIVSREAVGFLVWQDATEAIPRAEMVAALEPGGGVPAAWFVRGRRYAFTLDAPAALPGGPFHADVAWSDDAQVWLAPTRR